jgi:hypothetical protein
MKTPLFAFAVLSLSIGAACSSNNNTPSPGTGGSVGAGGSTGTGGTIGTGGTTGTGGGTTGNGGASGAGGTTGTTGTGGAAGGSSSVGGQSGSVDASVDGPLLYTLTVQNYLDWCDVTENGTVYPASVPPAMSFPPNTVVNLNAVPNYIFVWGYWTGTDGDKTSTHDMNMTTTVTMTSNKTILACCPDPPPAAPTCP